MKKISSISIILIFCYTAVLANGDHYDSSGKLMTVVACVAVILIGIVLFLFYIERRVTKIEGEFNAEKD